MNGFDLFAPLHVRLYGLKTFHLSLTPPHFPGFPVFVLFFFFCKEGGFMKLHLHGMGARVYADASWSGLLTTYARSRCEKGVREGNRIATKTDNLCVRLDGHSEEPVHTRYHNPLSWTGVLETSVSC